MYCLSSCIIANKKGEIQTDKFDMYCWFCPNSSVCESVNLFYVFKWSWWLGFGLLLARCWRWATGGDCFE